MVALGALLILIGLVGVLAPRLIRLPNRWAALGIVVVGILLAAAGSGGGTQPSVPAQADSSAPASSSQPQPADQKEQAKGQAGIGDAVQAGDVVLTVTKVERSNGDEFNRPQQGKVFLFVHIRLENKGDSPAPYNMFDAKVRDKNGNMERIDFPATVALGNRPQIESGELAPGGKVEGWLGFQVPKDDQAPVFVWEHGFLGTQEVEVILTEK